MIHFAPDPRTLTDAIIEADPGCTLVCTTVTTTTVRGNPAWLLTGGNRSGNFAFLLTRLTSTAYASIMNECGAATCAPFPLAHARRLATQLAPARVEVTMARWLEPKKGEVTLRLTACDLTEPTSGIDGMDIRNYAGLPYDLVSQVVRPIRIDIDLAPMCSDRRFARHR